MEDVSPRVPPMLAIPEMADLEAACRNTASVFS